MQAKRDLFLKSSFTTGAVVIETNGTDYITVVSSTVDLVGPVGLKTGNVVSFRVKKEATELVALMVNHFHQGRERMPYSVIIAVRRDAEGSFESTNLNNTFLPRRGVFGVKDRNTLSLVTDSGLKFESTDELDKRAMLSYADDRISESELLNLINLDVQEENLREQILELNIDKAALFAQLAVKQDTLEAYAKLEL